MQDNELDKLINDAASQHHPPYDDEAWGKMLVLLDKHLPQQKDRRRPVIFWLLFLLIGSAVTMGILQPWNPGKTKAVAGNNTTTGNDASISSLQKENTTKTPQGSTTGNETIPGIQNTLTGNTVIDKTKTNPGVTAAVKVPQTLLAQNNIDEAGGSSRKIAVTAKSRYTVKTKRPAAVSADEEITATVKPEKPAATKATSSTLPETATGYIKKSTEENETKIAAVNATATSEKKDTATAKQNTVTATVNKKEKRDKSFTSNFAVTVSAGADLSFVELSNPGKVKLFYGAGAAYAVGQHIKISTGFYVSKKVYDAAPYQYKFPNGATYPNLKEINANCNIYEIPVNIYYNFKQHKNHNWFAGAGLSSLLMKKEYYNYQYKTPAGQTYSYAKTITNENNHYFSVVTLSGGYQYKLSSRIALVAEPYLKLPLAGVGAGKIKLNSSGILLTAAVKPFAKSKK